MCLALRSNTGDNSEALKVIGAVSCLNRRIVKENTLVAVLKTANLAFADQVKDVGKLC